MKIQRRIAAAALWALAACSTSDAPLPDAGAEPDASDEIDLSEASWELEPVDGSGDTGFGQKLAFTGDGRAVAAWQHNDASAIGFAVHDPSGGWTVEAITPPDVSAVFSPDVAGGDGASAHLVFSASTDATGSDIFYASFDGSSLSAPLNLTGAGQGAADTDSSPVIAVTDAGQIAVLYVYTPDPMSFSRELRALAFTDPGSPGAFETVLDSTRNCGSLRALAVGDAVHASALCRGGGDEVVYLNRRDGGFTAQSAAFSGDSLSAPDLAVGTDGSIHLVAQTRLPCGEDTCTVPTYSKNLAPAIPATVVTESYFNPSIALDENDQPVIMFFELPGRELWWTFGTDAGFFRRQMVTTTGGGGKLVGTGGTDPATGLPWFILEDRERTPQTWLARLVQ